MKPVVLVGATGRMGTMVSAWLEQSEEFELVLGLGRASNLPAQLDSQAGALGLDLTLAGLGFEHGLLMLEAGLRPVIGTSGVTLDQVATLDRRARELELGGIVVPNFSLGMCALQEAARAIVAQNFQALEIIEMHHPDKLDSPSATALETARQLEQQLGRGDDSSPAPGAIPIHSLRMPGVQARQELIFGAAGERLNLSHEVLSREAYGPGVSIALHHASQALGIAHGLQAALKVE